MSTKKNAAYSTFEGRLQERVPNFFSQMVHQSGINQFIFLLLSATVLQAFPGRVPCASRFAAPPRLRVPG